MAGQPLEAMTLVGLGYRRLSMAARGIGPVRRMIRAMDTTEVADLVESLTARGVDRPRRALRAFAMDRGLPLG